MISVDPLLEEPGLRFAQFMPDGREDRFQGFIHTDDLFKFLLTDRLHGRVPAIPAGSAEHCAQRPRDFGIFLLKVAGDHGGRSRHSWRLRRYWQSGGLPVGLRKSRRQVTGAGCVLGGV